MINPQHFSCLLSKILSNKLSPAFGIASSSPGLIAVLEAAPLLLSAQYSVLSLPTMARNQSPSPADNFSLGHSATSPQPVSKRDKRRNMLADKVGEMVANFSDNRDSHYRAQLSALQADISLILKADPFANKPLDDSGEEAKDLIAQIMGNNVPSAPSAGTDYIAQVGKYYASFVDAVNDALEERDVNLTNLWVIHASTSTSILIRC